MVATIEATEDAIRASTPRSFQDAPTTGLDGFSEYDVSEGGTRIIYRKRGGDAQDVVRSQLIFVLNWLDELKRRVDG